MQCICKSKAFLSWFNRNQTRFHFHYFQFLFVFHFFFLLQFSHNVGRNHCDGCCVFWMQQTMKMKSNLNGRIYYLIFPLAIRTKSDKLKPKYWWEQFPWCINALDFGIAFGWDLRIIALWCIPCLKTNAKSIKRSLFQLCGMWEYSSKAHINIYCIWRASHCPFVHFIWLLYASISLTLPFHWYCLHAIW